MASSQDRPQLHLLDPPPPSSPPAAPRDPGKPPTIAPGQLTLVPEERRSA